MKLKSKIDYVVVIKYITVFCLLVAFSCIEKEVYPYSVAFYAVCLSLGASPFIMPILLIASFLLTGSMGLLAPVGISAVFILIVYFIYYKCNKKIKLELSLYVLISLTGYLILGDTTKTVLLEKRILVCIISCILTLILNVSFNAVLSKGLKLKYGYDEFLSLAITVTVIGLSVSNLLSPEVWKGVSAFAILCFAYLFRRGISAIISATLGLSLSLYYGRIEFVALFLVWDIAVESFMPVSRYISAFLIVFCDYLCQTVFQVYFEYGLFQILAVSIGGLVFCLIPTSIFRKIKDSLYTFREKQLVRQSINRNRIMTANRLFDLSNVFNEMKEAYRKFKKEEDINTAKDKMESKLVLDVCVNCDNKEKCKQNKNPKKTDIQKLIDIGLSKGKISLIDIPKDILSTCIHPNNIIFCLNKLLLEYRQLAIENLNYSSERELLALEAEGVSEILGSLALETGTLLKYQSRLERTLAENLFKKGFLVSELLIYGEGERTSVSLVVIIKDFSLPAINNVINQTVGMEMILDEKADITEEKCYLSFKKSPPFDAVFGVSSLIKDGSTFSGDTHAISRIKQDKFLLALSDGMGSGKNAENISSTSLSLIESFYKAGLKSNLILNTVNKLLAINTEDCFTAMDIAVVDLNNGEADFIKYGSPYGFIINQTGIQIIEGGTLPLGILEELSPYVCHVKLCEGDMILLVSDGISDAFGSSNEIIEYLKKVPALNPKSLSDGILNKALSLYNGKKKDDMTAIAVKIFKNKVVSK